MAGDYQGRTVYVVGGSQGVGLACARGFAAQGARLVLFARGAERLEAARREVAERGPGAFSHVLDATDAGAVARVMGEAVAESGAPDVLLNCVGGARPAVFEEIDASRLKQTLDWNLLACWHPVRALLPHLKQRRGIIVNTASVAGRIGVFGYTDYCAAKFAVVGFSEALRSEMKPHGVRVCVLCPPDTDTPGFAEEEKSKPPETRAVSGTGSLLSSEAVAQALLAGLVRQDFLIVPGRAARWALRARRFVPGWVDWFTDRAVARVRK